MTDFNSKYTGQQVEDLLDQVANGEIGGGIEAETDPIFSASPAATITEQKIAEWNSKSAQGDKGDKGDTGVGVASVAQTTTSNADGGSNVVTVTLTDGTKSTFTVKNGSKGSQGIQGEQGPKGDTGATGADGAKGDKGDKGDTGANGTNGVSVSSVKQTTTSTADGGTNVVTVTLSNGTTSTFSVKNGSKGTNGTNGTNGKDGVDGVTFTPSVDSNGNLSWTNNGGLPNPASVNIKGPKGDSGSGGGGSGESYAGNYPIYRSESASDSLAIQPNTFTILKYRTAYIISLYPPSRNDIVNEYIFAWYSHPNGNSLSLPSSIIWANDDVLIPEDYNTYIISIIDNVAVYIKVEGNIYNTTIPDSGGSN